MTQTDLAFRIRPYDHVCPLLLGEVETPGLNLKFDWRGPLSIQFPDELDAAEISFNRYLLARAREEDDLLGLPAFILRGFRHRNYFARRDSALTSLASLRGKRLATNSWGDSGTLWARAALRDAGVDIGDVQWVIGTLDENTPSRPMTGKDAQLPSGAEFLKDGDTLLRALNEGRVDAVTTAFAPVEVFKPDGWIRRLVSDYVEVERDYYRRTGVYPGFHIVAFRRSYAEAHPEAVVELYKALKRSWDVWWLKARRFAEASPWAMADLETMVKDFAGDSPPFGLSSQSHTRMLKTMCHEQHAQKLIDKPAVPERLFAGFLGILDRLGLAESELFKDDDLPPAARRPV